jgi:hypothetical protein
MSTLPNTLTRTLKAFAVLGALCLANGCASYKLGYATQLPFQTIYIQPATNHSYAPQAQAVLSAQLREVFIRDARVKVLANEEEADAVLLVDLTDYNRNPAARNANDTETAQNFDITLSSAISLYNQNTGEYFFEKRPVTNRTVAYIKNPYTPAGTLTTQSFSQTEYQTMPILARGLARKIADEVLSPW